MRARLAALRAPLGIIVALATLPFLAASSTAAPSTIIYSHGNHVVSARNLPGGGTEYLFAELAPGIAQGNGDVHSDGDHVHAADSGFTTEEVDCSIQGAYALKRLCGINRWHWPGTHPAVYFIDHSGAAWPVYEAVVQWNQSTAMDVGYRSGSWTCPAGVLCVHVYSDHYPGSCGDGVSNWIGCTYYGLNDDDITLNNNTYILLNDNYSGTYAQNQVTTCHEIGHALGLGHNLFTSSCLYPTRVSGVSKYPATGDYLMLESIY